MKKRWWLILFICYVAVMLTGTLAVRGRSWYEWVQLLVPAGRWRDLLVYPLQHHHPVTFAHLIVISDVISNIVLFMPLGLIIFLAFRRYTAYAVTTALWGIFLLAASASASIEFLQQRVPQRVPSCRDVVANVAGAMLGGGLGLLHANWKTRQAKLQLATPPSPTFSEYDFQQPNPPAATPHS